VIVAIGLAVMFRAWDLTTVCKILVIAGLKPFRVAARSKSGQRPIMIKLIGGIEFLLVKMNAEVPIPTPRPVGLLDITPSLSACGRYIGRPRPVRFGR
jgi:hypothetical protein